MRTETFLGGVVGDRPFLEFSPFLELVEWLRSLTVDGYEWLKTKCPIAPWAILAFDGDLAVGWSDYVAIMSAGCRVLVLGTLTVRPETVH